MELLYEIWNFAKIYLILATVVLLLIFGIVAFWQYKQFRNFNKEFQKRKNRFGKW